MGAPTVGGIMADILPYLGVEPNYSEEELQIIDRSVPNLVGTDLVSAQAQLSALNLSYRVIGYGSHVTMQLPAPNSVVAAQSQIVLFADGEESGDLEEVPDLTNLTYSIARQRLGYLALFIRTTGNNITDPEADLVMHQSIEPGTKVEHGTVIEVTLSNTNASMNGHY